MASQSLFERVYFHSAVPQKELLSFTTSADVGIIPYQATCLNNYYCTPNKLFEFIAAGIPIIASDLPEIRKIVQDKGIGLVAPTDNAENIASLIDRCFADPKTMLAWKKKLLIVQQELCWEQEQKKLLAIYQTL